MWVLGFEPETSGRPTAEPPLQHLRYYFKWKHFPNFCFTLFLAHEQRKALFSHFNLIPGNFTRFLISSSSCFMHSLVCFMHKIISSVHRVTCSLCKNIPPPFFPFPFLFTSARIPRTIKTINGRNVHPCLSRSFILDTVLGVEFPYIFCHVLNIWVSSKFIG